MRDPNTIVGERPEVVVTLGGDGKLHGLRLTLDRDVFLVLNQPQEVVTEM